MNFIDTAISYDPGFSEEIIAAALHPYPKGPAIATKGGLAQDRTRPDPERWRPQEPARFMRSKFAAAQSGTDRPVSTSPPEPDVPLTESVTVLAELAAEGKIKHVGLSNVALSQLQEACRIVPIASVQNRFSLRFRENHDVLTYCARERIAFIVGPAGRAVFQIRRAAGAAAGTDGRNRLAAARDARSDSPGLVAVARPQRGGNSDLD